MRALFVFFLLLLSLIGFSQEISDKEIRANFYSIKPTDDYIFTENLFHRIGNKKNKSTVSIAYYAVLECVLADSYYNPYYKLKNFTNGKTKLENILAKHPNDPEFRFLRLTIQTKSPSFLFYSSNIEKDKAFVIDSFPYFEKIGILPYVKIFLKEEYSYTGNSQ